MAVICKCGRILESGVEANMGICSRCLNEIEVNEPVLGTIDYVRKYGDPDPYT